MDKPQITAWPRLLSVELAAAYLSISPKTIRNALCKDAPKPFPVQPVKYGKRILFDRLDLDAYVDGLPRAN